MAEALSARAQELMAKYSIDHALLAAGAGRTAAPARRRLPADNPYEGPKAQLLGAGARANRGRAGVDGSRGRAAGSGGPAWRDAGERLFTSRRGQADTARRRAGAKRE